MEVLNWPLWSGQRLREGCVHLHPDDPHLEPALDQCWIWPLLKRCFQSFPLPLLFEALWFLARTCSARQWSVLEWQIFYAPCTAASPFPASSQLQQPAKSELKMEYNIKKKKKQRPTDDSSAAEWAVSHKYETFLKIQTPSPQSDMSWEDWEMPAE